MATAFENLKKHLELTIRQLKDIKQNKNFDRDELESLEDEILDLITDVIFQSEESQ